jgi:hypothetical protein
MTLSGELRRLATTLNKARWWSGTSDAVNHLTDAARELDRIPGMEQTMAGWQEIALRVQDGGDFWKERAGRLETALRVAAVCWQPEESAGWRQCTATEPELEDCGRCPGCRAKVALPLLPEATQGTSG